MSFTSKKPLIKQGSMFDSESKQKRPGLSTKRVSFGSTLLSDSDEENSLGRENRRTAKKKDDDDLLNLFKNELSDSDEDELVIGTKEKDKPRPKPRQKSESKTIKDDFKDDLLQAKQTQHLTDDLEQTINPKRKPRPPPRKRTGDSQSEEFEAESYEITNPKAHPRHSMPKEQSLSATRKSEIEVHSPQKEYKSRISIDDSDDDDIVVTSNKKSCEKVNKNSKIQIQVSKPKEDEVETPIEENVLSSSYKHQQIIDSKGAMNEKKSSKSKNKSLMSKVDSKSSEDEEDLHIGKYNLMSNKGRKELSEDSFQDKRRKNESRSMQSKLSEFENKDDFDSKRREKEQHKKVIYDSDDNDADGKRIRKYEPNIEKHSGQLRSSEFKNKETISKQRQKDEALATPKILIDDSDDNDVGVRRTKGKNESHFVENKFGSKKSHNGKAYTMSKMLQDDSDDENIRSISEKDSAQSKLLASDNEDMFRRKKQKDKSQAASKLLLDDSDDESDAHIQKHKVRNQKLSKDKNEIKDESGKYKDSVQVPQPRKRNKNTAKTIDSRKTIINDSDDDSDEGKEDSLSATKSRIKRDNNAKNPPRSVLQSKLHYLDDDDDDDDNDDTSKDFQVKSHQKTNAKTKTDDKLQSKKVAGWSSLDDSEDDDEAVGKRITLQKTVSSTAKKQDSQITKESTPKPSPRASPKPKPRHKDRNMKTNRKEEEIVIEKDSKPNRYDANQNLFRDNKDNRERQSNRGRVTPQRPSSSQMRGKNGWSRHEEDITDMFEEHIPDTSDVVGTVPDMERTQKYTRDHRRPQSAVTPKKGPMKADLRIEEMTKSPQLRQTMNPYHDNEDQDWRFGSQRSLGKQKSSSLTNLHQTGHTYYTGYDSDDDGRRNSLDTQSIRQTVYDNWLSRKNVTIKKELSKKALQKQKEEELAREQKEKKRSAKLAFKSWSESKNETLKEQQAKRRAEKKQEKEKDLEKELKKRDATKYFESWKSKKDEIIKGTHKEKKKEIMEKKKKEEEEKMEKTISSKKSFENWKSKKDDILKQQHKEKKKQEKLEGTKKQDEEYEKTIKNADEFQKWVENKGKPRKKPPSPTLTQRAWVPGSRHTGDCIPSKVQPVVLPPSSNRARTLSGTFRVTKKYYDY
ncbi:nucleolar protein dao-5 [Exaiptasia diaphana]|uniref:Uncharacterized protein n=1 Tax=Exaiptasia diaphana TaxID=2652724 RepID=A0A913Y2R6_EXADI|nr:nucleolar protein dao-5 [Exaiptasia diaphana]KXJ22990.1 Microtubule-associated protein 9 [Exaiptasia diaphana]